MLRRLLIVCFVFILLLAIGAIALFRWMLYDPHPSTHLAQGTLAIRDARVYPSPDEQPIDHASILIRDGRIVAVGTNLDIPSGTPTLPCDHCIVMAGFWNTHVHFTQARWAGAAFKPAPALNAGLSDMLTSRGFTTVVDLGSNPFDTVPLRPAYRSRRPARPLHLHRRRGAVSASRNPVLPPQHAPQAAAAAHAAACQSRRGSKG